MSDSWSSKFYEYFRIRTPQPLSAWADAHRVIADGASPEPGRWRTARTPYFRQIMDAVTDDSVSEVVVCSGIQLGKTELLLNAMCYYVEHEPSPIMLVEPSEDLVVQLGRERIDTMIKASPSLRPLFGYTEDLKVKTGVLSSAVKRFAGGYIKLASAASTTDLVSRPIRVVLCDEVDRYPARSDGNAIDMAIGRTTNFLNRKILITSSPGALQSSEVWRRLAACTRHEFRIPCPHCGEYVPWTWSMVKWDKSPDGVGLPETARMECPTCGGVVRDAGPASSVQLERGEWFCVQQGSANRQGFHVSGLLSPWMSLSGIVSEWLSAVHARDIDRLRTFVENRLAEPWEERPSMWHDVQTGEAPHSRFELEPDHTTIRFLTAGVDVQRDRVEVSVWGYGPNMESWAISHTVFTGDVLSARVWDEVRSHLAAPVTTADGRTGRIYAACIDSGDGYSTQTVYRFCERLSKLHIVAVKGVGGETVPMIAAPSRTPSGSPLYKLGVDRIKRVIYDRLGIGIPGPGYTHIPDSLSGEFWEQLTAESPETVVEHGRQVTRWKKTRPRNEALDCAVYAYAAFEIFCHPGLAKKRRK